MGNLRYISYTLENFHISLTLLENWTIRNTKNDHGAAKLEKKHWVDNPGAWERWKKEQGKMKKEQSKKEKGARG